MIKIKPNIVFSIIVIIYNAKNSSYDHIKIVKTIVYYLKIPIDCSIIYNDKKNLSIKNYLDSNWAKDKESPRSILSFIFILNKIPIS